MSWFTDLISGLGQGASDLSAGAGSVLSNTLNPLGGFINNLLGSTTESTTTTKPVEEKSGSKTMTIILISVAVVVVLVVAVIALKAKK